MKVATGMQTINSVQFYIFSTPTKFWFCLRFGDITNNRTKKKHPKIKHNTVPWSLGISEEKAVNEFVKGYIRW